MSVLTIKSNNIKQMTDVINKGLLASKMISASNYLCIRAEEGKLYLYNTDIDNHLEVSSNIDSQEQFKIFVDAVTFIKFINLLKEDINITLEVINNNLNIVYGKNRATINGIPTEDIEDLTYCLPQKGEVEIELDMEALKKCLNYLPASVNIDLRDTVLSNFYFKDWAASSNNRRISYLGKSPFGELTKDGLLIPPRLFKLLGVFSSEEKVYCSISENGFFVYTDNIAICGLDEGAISKYPSVDLLKIVQTSQGDSIVLVKDKIIEALSRLKIFVKVEDRGAIHFIASDKVLRLNTLNKQCIEEVPFEGEIAKFEGHIDIENLLSVLSIANGSNIELTCDNDRFLRVSIPSEEVVFVSSLMAID